MLFYRCVNIYIYIFFHLSAKMFPIFPQLGNVNHFEPQRYRDSHWNLVQDLDAMGLSQNRIRKITCFPAKAQFSVGFCKKLVLETSLQLLFERRMSNRITTSCCGPSLEHCFIQDTWSISVCHFHCKIVGTFATIQSNIFWKAVWEMQCVTKILLSHSKSLHLQPAWGSMFGFFSWGNKRWTFIGAWQMGQKAQLPGGIQTSKWRVVTGIEFGESTQKHEDARHNVKADFRFQRTVHSTFVPYQSKKISKLNIWYWKTIMSFIKKLLLLVHSNVTSGNGT